MRRSVCGSGGQFLDVVDLTCIYEAGITIISAVMEDLGAAVFFFLLQPTLLR